MNNVINKINNIVKKQLPLTQNAAEALTTTIDLRIFEIEDLIKSLTKEKDQLRFYRQQINTFKDIIE